MVIIVSHPVVLNELARSPVHGILVILGVVVIEVMLMIVGAAWHAANDWQANFLTRAHSLHLAVKVRLVHAQSTSLWLTAGVE